MPSNALRIFLGLSLVLVLLCPVAAASRDEWHFVYIEGKRAGYSRMQVLPHDGGGFITTMTEKMVLQRGKDKVETEVTSSQEEDEDGRLLGFRYRQKLARNSMESTGTVRGGDIVVVDTVGGGKPRESRIALDPKAVGPWKAEKEIQRCLKKPGDAVESVIFLPEVRRFGKQRAVLGEKEPVECEGSRQELRRLKLTVDIIPEFATEEWIDEEFRPWKSSMAVLGMRIVTCRATVEAVLAEDFSSPPEIFLASSIPVRKSVPPQATETTYRLTAKGAAFPVREGSCLFDGPRQRLLREEGPRTRVLRVRKVLSSKRVERPVPPTPELAEHLRPNSYVQSDDKVIIGMAEKHAGKDRDAWETARNLEAWVHDSIRTKDLNTAFATASEVASTMEGDCTEHSVLLAAILRASGLPSRVVAGLLYHKGAFVGHMWTEVWIGEWIALDATLGRGGVGSDHIALVTSSLDSATVSQFFLDMMPLLGNLEIEVLDIVE